MSWCHCCTPKNIKKNLKRLNCSASFYETLFYFCSDIALISVGITSEVNEDFLAAISGDAGTTNGQLGYDYFKSPDFQTLNSILETVSQGICTRRAEGMEKVHSGCFST